MNNHILNQRSATVLCALSLLSAIALPEIEAAAEPTIKTDEAPISRETKAATSFAPIIKKVSGSVVNIYTTKSIRINPRMLEDPMYRFFFGDPGDDESGRSRVRREQSLGSGVILTEDGYILTNNHVVEGADEIQIALADSKKKIEARIVGGDPHTDIAVIKVDAKDLPAITVTDSDKLEVGDTVMAIGNPFGVGQTVTLGIVSATGRGGMGIVDYEDFIQTDASINPGNSGGALVDAEGRLVGINTAILSRTGGNQGIGFAVPINLARSIMERIVKDGKVTRGYLGVLIQPLTPELAKEFKLPDQNGALVGEVTDKSPAGEAGIKEGDVIIEFNGRKVADNRQLRLVVSQTAPGTKANVKVMREGSEKSFTVTLAALPEEGRAAARTFGGVDKSDLLDGIGVADLDANTRRQLDIPEDLRGALVTRIDPSCGAYEAGLREGDVLLEIGRKPVANADDAVELSNKVKGDRVLLRVWSKGGSRYVVVDAAKKPK